MAKLVQRLLTSFPCTSSVSCWVLKKTRLTRAIRINENLYAATARNRGVVFFDDDGTIIRMVDDRNGLVGTFFKSLLLDRWQTLWVTTGSGLYRLDLSSPVTHTKPPLGWDIESIFAFDGAVYAACNRGLLRKSNLHDSFNVVKRSRWMSSLVQFQNRLLVAGGDGLFEVFPGGMVRGTKIESPTSRQILKRQRHVSRNSTLVGNDFARRR